MSRASRASPSGLADAACAGVHLSHPYPLLCWPHPVVHPCSANRMVTMSTRAWPRPCGVPSLGGTCKLSRARKIQAGGFPFLGVQGRVGTDVFVCRSLSVSSVSSVSVPHRAAAQHTAWTRMTCADLASPCPRPAHGPPTPAQTKEKGRRLQGVLGPWGPERRCGLVVLCPLMTPSQDSTQAAASLEERLRGGVFHWQENLRRKTV